MIRYTLKCRKDHEFEGWFRDSALFDSQVAAGEVVCPVCGSKKVEKALMAPRVSGGRGRGRAAKEAARAGEVKQALRAMRKHVEANCDYVGPAFAEEARKIHYGETEHRNIYGETSGEEAKSLEDEGVEVQRIPWVPLENS